MHNVMSKPCEAGRGRWDCTGGREIINIETSREHTKKCCSLHFMQEGVCLSQENVQPFVTNPTQNTLGQVFKATLTLKGDSIAGTSNQCRKSTLSHMSRLRLGHKMLKTTLEKLTNSPAVGCLWTSETLCGRR